MDWVFYQVSPLTLDLNKSLLKAKTYVTGGNTAGKYEPETYLGFLEFVQEAMNFYNQHRNTFSTQTGLQNTTRAKSDNYVQDLNSYMALLDIEEDGPTSYMDIPMEVLDFRADGLMFDCWNIKTAYSLQTTSPTTMNGVPRPGTIVPCEQTSTNSSLNGAIEDDLVNGQIVYTEETITYIANALHLQHHTFDDPAASSTGNYRDDFGTEDMDKYYNSAFMQWVDPIGTANSADTATPVDNYGHL